MDILLVLAALIVIMLGTFISRGLTLRRLARRGREATAAIVDSPRFNLASGGSHRKIRYKYQVEGKQYRGSSFIKIETDATHLSIMYDPSFPFLSAPRSLVKQVQKLNQNKKQA